MVVQTGISSHGHRAIMLKCKCGREFVAMNCRLMKNPNRTCQIGSCRSGWKTGLSKHPDYVLTYNSWKSMIARCLHPTSTRYKEYGAVGVSVCDKWKEFGGFVEDMGKRPGNRYSIDRIDNSLGYFKENCRWATHLEQTRNRSNSITLTHNGITQSVFDWSKQIGIRPNIVYSRLKRGWNAEMIFTTPVGNNGRKQTKEIL